jgi:hypothetical protein
MDANKEQKLKAFLAQIVSSDLQRSPEACWISSRPRTNSNIAKTRRLKSFGIGIRLNTKRKISVQKAVAVSSTL